jgi:hypothetical protein
MNPADEIAPEDAKTALLRYTSRLDEEDFNRNWCGCLNEANIFIVAARIRKILEDKIFAVAEYRYVNTNNPAWELQTDCYFNSRWTEGPQDMVRVFLTAYPYIGFSAGGFLYSWSAAPGDDYDETHRYAFIDFNNGDQVTFKQLAPNGTLHVHIFRVQRDNDIEEVR